MITKKEEQMATYTKLRSGEWGIRVAGGALLARGATVTVIKKNGESKTETVQNKVWSGNGVALYAIQPRSRDFRGPGNPEYDGGRRGGKPCYQRRKEMKNAEELANKAGVMVIGTQAVQFDGRAKRSLGEIRKSKGKYYLVVSTAKSYYHSEGDCEDMDCFCGRYGHIYPYSAIEVSEPTSARKEREKRQAEMEAAKTAEENAAAAYRDALAPAADYRQRHGALIGGTVTIGDWSQEIAPPMLDLDGLQWEQIEQYGQQGRTDTLYRSILPDGRPIFRETHIQYDDWRQTYHLPDDVFRAVVLAEIQTRGTTKKEAQEWLEKYRGCVDTEYYEIAAGEEVTF